MIRNIIIFVEILILYKKDVNKQFVQASNHNSPMVKLASH